MPQSKLTIRSWPHMLSNKDKTDTGNAAPIWGGLPEYSMEENEQVQNRYLKILGLPQNELQTLKERMDNITMEEIRGIIKRITLTPAINLSPPLVLTTNTNYGRSLAFHSGPNHIHKDMTNLLFLGRFH